MIIHNVRAISAVRALSDSRWGVYHCFITVFFSICACMAQMGAYIAGPILVAPWLPGDGLSDTLGLHKAAGNAFPWGGLATGRCGDTHRQAGRQSTALTGASLRSCHETKRFRILATLKQGNKSMYSNTSGYVHMGLRLDWGKGITGQ